METKKFVDLKNPIKHVGNTYNKLRVVVDYQKAGINYFSGNYNNGGVYVYLTPCAYSNGIVGQTICGNQHISGYKVFVKELNRKSQKQINLIAEKVMPLCENIADLYSEAKHREIYDLITSLI